MRHPVPSYIRSRRRSCFYKVQFSVAIVTLIMFFILANGLIYSIFYPESYDNKLFTNSLLSLSFVSGISGITWLVSWFIEDFV
jgi:hypothetical protein